MTKLHILLQALTILQVHSDKWKREINAKISTEISFTAANEKLKAGESYKREPSNRNYILTSNLEPFGKMLFINYIYVTC